MGPPQQLTTLGLQDSPSSRLRQPWEVIDEELLPELSMDLVFGDLKRLQPDGGNFKSCCPIHGGPESDGFFINPKRLEWTCFLGCGGGGPIQFLQKTQKITWIEAAQALAVMAGVDPSKLEAWGRHWTEKDFERHDQLERRAILLHLLMSLTRSAFQSATGKSLRGFLEGRHGFTEKGMNSLEMGLYTDPAEVFPFLKRTGQDLAELRSRGFFEGDWSGRVLVPWRDYSGRIVNLWSWNPSGNLLGDSADSSAILFERDHLGSQRSPFCLFRALERETLDLILMDDPLEAVQCAAMGVLDPFPIAAKGKLTSQQVDVLDRALAKTGSLTLLSTSQERGRGGADPAAEQLKPLELVGFPVFVVDSRLMVGDDGRRALSPSQFIRERGLGAFSQLLKQSEVVLGVNELGRTEPEGWGGLGKVFRGIRSGSDRGGPLVVAVEDPGDRASAGQSAFLGVMLHAAEELGQRIAQGFLKALPKGFGGGALPAGDSSAQLQLPERVESGPPPVFSVDRLEESSHATASSKPTGWRELDELGIRFRPGELTLVGGRTGHGRTSALVGLLVFWLFRTEEKLVFLSYDESEIQIYHRLLSLLTAVAGRGLSVNFIRNHLGNAASPETELDEEQWLMMENARDCLRGWEERLHLIYRPGWSAVEIEGHLKSLSEDGQLGGLLVDPVDKISSSVASPAHGVARWLKTLAVDLACPVVAALRTEKSKKPAKLKRKNLSPDWDGNPQAALEDPVVLDKIRQRRPRLSDFTEEMEREADQILGLLSHAMEFASLSLGSPPETATLEVGVLKNRSGPTGDWVELLFDGPFCLVRDPE